MKLVFALPTIAYLIYRSYTHQSLTHLGILTATLTALIHAAHPSPLPFTLLVVFFLAGTSATKVKHDLKSRLTLSSTGGITSSTSSSATEGGRPGAGGEGARTYIQVLSNSGVASLLVLLHLWRGLSVQDRQGRGGGGGGEGSCIPTTGSTSGLILSGIVANYAAVAADTFSSELGILAKQTPRLITRPWVEVPRGTNGGVTIAGLGAGVLGAAVAAVTSVLLMPFCGGGPAAGLGPVGRVLMFGEKEELFRGWTVSDKLVWVLVVTGWGALGSVLDSVLGAVLQASVVDRRTGKIVEGAGGERVLVSAGKTKEAKRRALHTERNKDEALKINNAADTGDSATQPGSQEESRMVLVGSDWLDNNHINLLMAACMSLGGMAVASWYWGIPLSTIWT